MIRFLKEPLVHFLVLGGGLFLLFGLIGGNEDGLVPEGEGGIQNEAARRTLSKEIVVSKGQIESLIAQFSKVWQRTPTEQELTGLIDTYIREEVMYRQALELGLDRDDAIVRRRMRQKLEFFTNDIAALVKPTEDELTDYLESHPEPYRFDSKFTFKQVYLNPERRADSIDSDIDSLLEVLRAAGASADISEAGDSSLLEQVFEATPKRDVAKVFGQEFSQGLLKVKTGTWQGPVSSGFGQHLVYISERIDGRLPSLDEARDAVERDWMAAKRKESNEAVYEKWRADYKVTVEDVDPDKEVTSR